MIDCKQLPIPKYNIGDKVWIINNFLIEQVEIDCVEIKGRWFDNGYCSKHEFVVEYEIANHWSTTYTEDQFYNSKRTAQRRLQQQKIQHRKNSINDLKNEFLLFKNRCSVYGLTIDDL